MTRAEETRLYVDHVTRGGDLCFDQLLARAVLARHARSTGKQFIYLSHLEST